MNVLHRKAKRALEIGRQKGLAGIAAHSRHKLLQRRERLNYQKWIQKFDVLDDAERAALRRRAADLETRPLISVVMPVYDVAEKWLRLCVESVRRQLYENWELCIADDCSPSPHIRRILEEYAAQDERVKIVFRPQNGHISAASNSALALAGGEFTVLLDHDDELTETALFYVAREINEHPATAMIYSDEDMIDENGRRYEPKFKPDWSRDLFYSLNLVTHLSAYRTDVLRAIGGFRVGAEGSQDYDLALRVIEQIGEHQIRHIPKILYHWRAIKGSVALSGDEKPYAHERAREALRSHFERCGKRAVVSQSVFNLHRVSYALPATPPKVSLIIAVNDLDSAHNALSNLRAATDYQNFEMILVGSSASFEAASFTADEKTRLIVCQSDSEAEKYNFAVSQAEGEILCFVDINLQPASNDWLAEMVGFACQPEIGAVGAKILNPNETVLHGGLIVGVTDEKIGSAHRNFPSDDGGSLGRNVLTGNFSAVSVSCLAVRREAFQAVGGFDAEHFPDRFFDADFCLKLGARGKRIVYTPYAELTKVDAKKRLNLERRSTAEKDNFAARWRSIVERDPFYNPNLSSKDANFSIKI